MDARRKKLLRRGSILILTLWMLILLGVITLSYTSSVRTQLMASGHSQARVQAYWAARAGIEKARAILETTSLDLLTDDDPIFNDDETFKDQEIGDSHFSLDPPVVGEGEERHGLMDEGALINVNTADELTLMKLPGMTDELAQCLEDWRDRDNNPRVLGAEDEYYGTLDNPYPVKNGPLDSVRELMRVRAWDSIFNAAHPDPFTRFLPEGDRPEAADGGEANKLLSYLTAWSMDRNLAPDGKAKINVASASAGTLTSRIPKLSAPEAAAITDYQSKTRFKAVTDLLEVPLSTLTPTPTPTPKPGTVVSTRPTPTPKPSRAGKMFSLERVGQIIDYLTIETSTDPKPGTVNINTASYDTMMLLPGMTEAIAQAILQQRGGAGAFKGVGGIASLAGMDEQPFKLLYPRLMASTMRFRAVSRGRDPSGGTAVTIEAVLSVESGAVKIVYWHEE